MGKNDAFGQHNAAKAVYVYLSLRVRRLVEEIENHHGWLGNFEPGHRNRKFNLQSSERYCAHECRMKGK